MSYDQLFLVVNAIAVAAWLLLLVFPFRPFTSKVLIGVVVTILCVVYAVVLYQILQPTDFNKFRTLQGVMSLFSTPGAVLAGWIHYLAFDLMVGLFIAHNAAKHGISYLWVLPCLLATFMVGPIGLLMYFLFRWSITKYYFAENF